MPKSISIVVMFLKMRHFDHNSMGAWKLDMFTSYTGHLFKAENDINHSKSLAHIFVATS